MRNLINTEKVYQACDVDVLKWMSDNELVSVHEISRAYTYAIRNNSLAMTKFLVEIGAEIPDDAVSTALNHGYRELTQYLHSQGQIIKQQDIAPVAGVDFGSEMEAVTFFKSVGLDLNIVHDILIRQGNFVLAGYCIKGPSLNVQMTMWQALKRHRRDIIQLVQQHRGITPDEWQDLIMLCVSNNYESSIQLICQDRIPIVNLDNVLAFAHRFLSSPVLNLLIETYDPNLHSDIHTQNYVYICLKGDLALAQKFCARFPAPTELNIGHVTNAGLDVVQYLWEDKGWNSAIHPLMDQLLTRAICQMETSKVKFYHKLGAKYDVPYVHKHLANKAGKLEYDFLVAIMEIGINADFLMTGPQRERYKLDIMPKLIIHNSQGLRWLAASTYCRHFECLPDPSCLPEDVWRILQLAKYRY